MIPPLAGILETCLYVDDVERSRAFYERVFGFSAMIVEPRICAFDVAPAQVLILFQRGGTTRPVAVGSGFIPPHDASGPQHFAFAIGEGAYEDWKRHLGDHGITLGKRGRLAAGRAQPVFPRSGRDARRAGDTGGLAELLTRIDGWDGMEPLVSAGEKPHFMGTGRP